MFLLTWILLLVTEKTYTGTRDLNSFPAQSGEDRVKTLQCSFANTNSMKNLDSVNIYTFLL